MVDNTIALQVKPLDIATPLMQAAKMRQMESEQQRLTDADNREHTAAAMRGLAPYADSPEFAGRWAQTFDDLGARGIMRGDIVAQKRNNPSVMEMNSVLRSSESPEMGMHRDKMKQDQANADRAFQFQKDQAGAPTVTSETHDFMGGKTSSTTQRILPGQQPYSPPIPAGGAAASASGIPISPTTGQPMQGEELFAHIKRVDPVAAAALKDMYEGKQNPNARNLQKLAPLASLVFPGFDANDYPSRLKLRNSYTSGPDNKEIQALNTVSGHLSKLMDSAEGLGNTGFKPWNYLKNMAADATIGSPALVKFRNDLVTTQNELAKAYHGGHVSDSAYNAFSKAIGEAQTPAELKAAIGELSGLLHSKIATKDSNYTAGMQHAPLPEAYSSISNEAKSSFSRINDWANGIKRPPGAAPRAAARTENDPPEISAAREAIAKGADRAKVEQRLKQNGIKFSPGDLEL